MAAEPYSLGVAAYAALFPRPEAELAALCTALGPGAGRCLVDLGAGLGVSALGLAAAGWQVQAVEPDPEMAAGLGTRLALTPALQDRVALLPSSTGLRAGQADAVLCQSVLHLLSADAQHALLTEAARLLRPGGTLWIESPFLSPTRQPIAWERVGRCALGSCRVEHHRAMQPDPDAHPKTGPEAWTTDWRFELWQDARLLHEISRRYRWTPLSFQGLARATRAAGLHGLAVWADWAGRTPFDPALAGYGYARCHRPHPDPESPAP